MGRIWSEERRFETWLQVEIAAAEAMAEAGIIPHEAARDIRERVAIRRRPHRRDRRSHPARRHCLHHRRGRARRSLGALAAFRAHLLGRRRHRAGSADARGVRPHHQGRRRRCWRPFARGPRSIARTPMIGRTHGVHAEPMTFGLKLALWYAELQRDRERLRARARWSRSARSPAPSGRSRISIRRSKPVCARARAGAGAGVVAGHSARSSR